MHKPRSAPTEPRVRGTRPNPIQLLYACTAATAIVGGRTTYALLWTYLHLRWRRAVPADRRPTSQKADVRPVEHLLHAALHAGARAEGWRAPNYRLVTRAGSRPRRAVAVGASRLRQVSPTAPGCPTWRTVSRTRPTCRAVASAAVAKFASDGPAPRPATGISTPCFLTGSFLAVAPPRRARAVPASSRSSRMWGALWYGSSVLS